MNTYDRGFADGVRASLDLLRAGAAVDDLGTLLPSGDPGLAHPQDYSEYIACLRRKLNLGFGDVVDQ